MAFVTLGVIILWFGWFGFNAGSTLSVDYGGVGFFAYVALNTNIAAAAGVLGAVLTSWLVIKKPDLSMMLNGAVAALVAITAACAFVAPSGGHRDRSRCGRDRRRRRPRGRADWDRQPDRCDRSARHGGRMGHACGWFPRVAVAGREAGHRFRRSLLRRRLHQLGVQVLGLAAVGAFTFTISFGVLWVMKVTVGIRTDAETETAGLDISEHGMWGYPEFSVPVPGGYGTESHGPTPRRYTRGGPSCRRASACSCRPARRAAVGRRACPLPPSAAAGPFGQAAATRVPAQAPSALAQWLRDSSTAPAAMSASNPDKNGI